MKPDLDVAETLECEPELLPHLPEILQDFDDLGSDPQRFIECLDAASVAEEVSSALELCCGKGATAIALAKRYGMRVDAIDAMDAFIQSARTAAARAGVDELCRFTARDLCDAVRQPGDYGLVVLGSVGPILGGITETVRHLMTPLRSRGWILIGDSVLLPGAPSRPGFEAHAELDETHRRIEKSGAEVVLVHSFACDADGFENDIELIVRRAATLVERRPELAAQVARYVERQRDECVFLERWTRDVTWLLRKPAVGGPAQHSCSTGR